MKLFFLLAIFPSLSFSGEPDLSSLVPYPGYKVSVYAADVENARSLTLGKNGVVYVGTRANDKVFALLPDKNNDGRSDGVKVVAKGLNTPNGVAYKEGDLYIAEVSRLLRIRGIDQKLEQENKPEPWGPSFPKETHHGWKFIAFGPDGWLYVPVGAPCNNCLEDQDLYAAIHRVSPDGKKREIVARGVRNTVGFDWDPRTKQLWFTENGRDWMGDEIPPCELNVVSKAGEHFGFPFCQGGIADPEFGKQRACAEFTAPTHKFPAHSAPLGIRILRRQKSLNGAFLVAEHGSWNRTNPIGYQVTLVQKKADGGTEARPFLRGFLGGSSAWGRPVDVLELPDNSILVSDDKANAVYRLTAQ